MKILLVQPYALGPGHYDAYTKRICEGFCKAGLDITLVTALGTKDGWDKKLPMLSVRSLGKESWITTRTENRFGSKFFSRLIKGLKLILIGWVVQRKAFSIFKKNGHDVVHFIDSEFITLTMLFYFFGKPKNVFITVPAPLEMRNIFLEYTYNSIRKMMVSHLLKRAHPIFHTEQVKNSLIHSGIISDSNAPVIPWGIDVIEENFSKEESRNRLGIDIHKKVFGFFGYLLPQKGFDFTLETWASLQKEYVLLALVHSDCLKDGETINEFIKNNHMEDRVLLNYGYTLEEDLALNISACDAILLPYKKNFQGESGIMSLACSHGVPLIAANVGKVGDTVERKGLGFVFEPESSRSFIDTLIKFSKLSEEEIKKIKESISAYVKFLSWEQIARSHVDCYKKYGNPS